MSATTSDKSPKVTVVMPAYDAGPALRQAVAAIQAQSLTDWELIVVDDASTDGSTDFLNSPADPRVYLLVNERNIGAARARNRAIAASRGTYSAVADADDIAPPFRLERQASFLDAHPDVSLAAGATCIFGTGSRAGSMSTPLTTHEGLTLGLRLGPSFYHGSVMVRSGALRSRGYHDVPPAEDHDMSARLLGSGHRLAAQPDLALFYRDHAGGVSKTAAARAREVHAATSNRVQADVVLPDVRHLVRAARSEPSNQAGQPRLRMLKLLIRTAAEHLPSRPMATMKCIAAALAVGPMTWCRAVAWWISSRQSVEAPRS